MTNQCVQCSVQIPGIESIHELHIWRLNQQKSVASAHVIVSDDSIAGFMEKTKVINECFHAYGVHSTTLQPEPVSRYLSGDVRSSVAGGDDRGGEEEHGVDGDGGLRLRETRAGKKDFSCVLKCSGSCDEYACCD